MVTITKNSKETLNNIATIILGERYLNLSLIKNKVKDEHELHKLNSEIEDIINISSGRDYDDMKQVYIDIMKQYNRAKNLQSIYAEKFRNAAEYFYKRLLG